MNDTATKKAEIRAAKRYLAQGRKLEKNAVAFMLRSCDAEMKAYGGFTWPATGAVECPDWQATQACGNGLHGLLWGVGDASLTAGNDAGAKWLVCAVWSADVVDLGSKVKAPRAWVVFCGARDAAVAEIIRLGAVAPIYGTATAGYAGTATAGYAGTATAGDDGTATAGASGTATAGYAGTATAGDAGTATAGARGTATAGDDGTATAGASGTATAGDDGTATAGARGTATAGDAGTATAGARGTATAGARGTATAGYAGTATAGYAGTATAGDDGTATAGASGTATAGDDGTATAGARGTATAGDDGMICIKRWDGKRWRMVVGHIGEDGLEKNTPYKLDGNGAFVRADRGRR